MTGVDLSEGMLEFARRNSPQSCFVQADVCSVKLPEKFDAAVSTFDSLNHLPDLTSLGRCFRSVATALKPGARFLFDLNMQLGFELRWWARATLQVDELSCEIEADYRTGENQARNNVRILRPDGSTDRCFSIVENCWPEEAICQTLRQSGFRSVRVFDGHADAGLWGEIGRSFFLATVEDTAANPAED